MNSPHGITEDATNLLDWGFKAYDTLQPVGTLVKPVAAAPKTAEGTGPSTSKKASALPPKRNRPTLAAGVAVQSIAMRVPVWAYAAPPILLLSLFLRRPKALKARARAARGRRH
jgi:D-alanyl-D-alanine carboxypeptidase (penicillin-binding protein 5/6)